MEYMYEGKSRTLKEIAELVGINFSTLKDRLYKGMPFEKAISTPPMRASTVKSCKATSGDECFTCSYPDCIRKATNLLDDERKGMKYGKILHAID